MTFHEDKARAQILKTIKTVTNYGKAYDYDRYVKNWTDLRSLFTSTISEHTYMRGWVASLVDMDQESETFGAAHGDMATRVEYIYRIRGFEAVRDAEASEKSFVTLVLAVIKAIDEDPKLHYNSYEDGANSNFVGSPVERISTSYRMFGGVLCHFVEMFIQLEEYV